jgi:hypothetical protein
MRKNLVCMSIALALPLAAAAPSQAALAAPVPKLCSQMQKDGWRAPLDLRTHKPGKAEMKVGGLYVCMVSKELPRGAGHAPDLEAVLTDSGDGPGVVVAAHIWCAADRAATLDLLAKQLESMTGSVPPDISAALRAGKAAKASAQGLSFEVEPVEVDPDACKNVPADQLGPMLIEVGVKVGVTK